MMTPKASYNNQTNHPQPVMHRQTLLLIAVLLGLSIAYFAGLASVPFHPDESTQIYMSRDFDLFFQDLSQLFWRADKSGDPRQSYRLLDAPLTRYLIAAGLKINPNTSPLAAGWDWSKSWAENQKAGALPGPAQLLTARASVALLFPFSCLLIFKIGSRLGGKPTAWLSLLLLAGNALVLVHTRRAMAESLLVFSVILTLYLVIRRPPNPWLLGLAVAVAFNAKQSALALFILGIFALLFSSNGTQSWKDRSLRLAPYFLTFILVTFLLNPFLWGNPIKAGAAAWDTRRDLLAAQVESFGAGSATQVLRTPAERLAGSIANLYFTPPQIAETGNYSKELQNATTGYLANPSHNLLRGFVSGGVLLIFTLFGYVVLLWRAARSRDSLSIPAVLVCAAGMLQFLFNLALIPLSFQRYTISLVPFICIFSAFGLTRVIKIIKRRVAPA